MESPEWAGRGHLTSVNQAATGTFLDPSPCLLLIQPVPKHTPPASHLQGHWVFYQDTCS